MAAARKTMWSLLPVTVPAVASYLKGMSYSREADLPAELFLNGLEFRGEYLDDRPAFHTYTMVMVSVAERVLVVSMFVIFLHLFDKTAFEKKGQSPVDRSLGNLCFLSPYAYEELLGIEMSVEGRDLVQDPFPFFCELETLSRQELLENLFLHGHILKKMLVLFQCLPH